MSNSVQLPSSPIEHSYSSRDIFSQQLPPAGQQRPPLGVRQDKDRATSARSTSPQPDPVTNSTRAKHLENTHVRSHNRSLLHQPAEKVTSWIPSLLKAELVRIAERNGLSLSQTIAALLEKLIQQDLHQQHEAVLFPMFKKALHEEFLAFGNRIVFFLMRIAFAAEQSRILITNV